MSAARKLQDDLAYPPRAMRAERAAAYLDLSPNTFFRLVDEGLLPQGTRLPGHSVVTWDRLDLDAAYDDWKTASAEGKEVAGDKTGNTMHNLLMGRGKQHG